MMVAGHYVSGFIVTERPTTMSAAYSMKP